MKRLLVTGSREARGEEHIFKIRESLTDAYMSIADLALTLVQGNAKGVDSIAKEFWLSEELPVESHPANWQLHGKSAGPKRNQKMVDLGADLCVAFFIEGVDSRGTKHCLEAAEKAGIPVWKVTLPALPDLDETPPETALRGYTKYSPSF